MVTNGQTNGGRTNAQVENVMPPPGLDWITFCSLHFILHRRHICNQQISNNSLLRAYMIFKYNTALLT